MHFDKASPLAFSPYWALLLGSLCRPYYAQLSTLVFKHSHFGRHGNRQVAGGHCHWILTPRGHTYWQKENRLLMMPAFNTRAALTRPNGPKQSALSAVWKLTKTSLVLAETTSVHTELLMAISQRDTIHQVPQLDCFRYARRSWELGLRILVMPQWPFKLVVRDKVRFIGNIAIDA